MILRPFQIEQNHWDEWLASGVDPEITALNIVSVSGNAAYDFLFYGEKVPRRNDGRLRDGVLKKYRHIDFNNWWCSGTDPLNNCLPMLWGCMKPDKPRRDTQKILKVIKYEHPYRVPTRAFFLRITWRIGWKIAKSTLSSPNYQQRILLAYRASLKTQQKESHPSNNQLLGFGEQLHPTDEPRQKTHHLSPIAEIALLSIGQEEDCQFWHWAWEQSVPIVICEGAKKAGALLTQGYAAIALSGVNGGYRNPKDPDGNPLGQPFLIPDLQHFATSGREVAICFDHDSKPQTVQRVQAALTATARLLSKAGCSVGIITLPGPEKGVDDFIAAGGNFHSLYQAGLTFEEWQVLQYTKLTYTPSLVINQRYLGDLPIPNGTKFIGLKAPKGSGKTQSFIPIVTEAIRNGQPVILLGHRVQLVQTIADRIGIPYITEVKTSETGILLGYGLCVDSLHPNSQARFDADNWHNAIVIIDECEQVIWHTLTASTEVKKHRVEVISQLSRLLHNTLNSEFGMLIASDADLSNLTIEFINGVAGVDVQPWLLVNTWKPEKGWNIRNYNQTTPIVWFAAIEEHIRAGGRPFIVTHSQKAKSTWGTINIEARLSKQFPHLKILRIDSQTIADPTHRAYGCISKLNSVIKDFDIVLVSPSIETGVSIDVRNHFTSVWGCLLGVSPDNSARQSLARVREEVDRHIWVAKRGLGHIGNGAISLKSLLASEHSKFKSNVRLLQDAGMSLDGDDLHVNKTALHTWAKMSCRVNAGMTNYRTAVLAGLKDEGHHIIDTNQTPDNNNKQLHSQLKELKATNYHNECVAIAHADISTLSTSQYEALTTLKSKTVDERRIERKYSLQQRYHTEITPELVEKDDHGWYPQLRLHYFLSLGKPYLPRRDTKVANATIHDGKVWMPDFNSSQIGTAIATLELLGIPALLTRDRLFRANDEDLLRLSQMTQANRWSIKSILNISIPPTNQPIVILRRILNKLGLKLNKIGRDGTGDRQRVYQIVGFNDRRDDVFNAWLEVDEASTVKSPAATRGNKEIHTPVVDKNTQGKMPVVAVAGDQSQIGNFTDFDRERSLIANCTQMLRDGINQGVEVVKGILRWTGVLRWQVVLEFFIHAAVPQFCELLNESILPVEV